MMPPGWMIATMAAAGYCVVRGVLDLRAKRYVLGVAGLAAAVAILNVPIPTHAVAIDLYSGTR
jgi:hypothetical protein